MMVLPIFFVGWFLQETAAKVHFRSSLLTRNPWHEKLLSRRQSVAQMFSTIMRSFCTMSRKKQMPGWRERAVQRCDVKMRRFFVFTETKHRGLIVWRVETTELNGRHLNRKILIRSTKWCPPASPVVAGFCQRTKKQPESSASRSDTYLIMVRYDKMHVIKSINSPDMITKCFLTEKKGKSKKKGLAPMSFELMRPESAQMHKHCLYHWAKYATHKKCMFSTVLILRTWLQSVFQLRRMRKAKKTGWRRWVSNSCGQSRPKCISTASTTELSTLHIKNACFRQY